MQQAIELAKRGLYTASPNPRVGCLLLKDEKIIGRGWHHRAGLAHAEVDALNNCVADPRGATAYVTLEPCSFYGKTPPCSEALLSAGIGRLIVGSKDPNPRVDSLKSLKDAGIEVAEGCEEEQCIALNPGFFSRMQRKRPWVRVKMAMSLDGRTALANGVSQWITSAQARSDVQRWRARADCILTGSGTVLDDNPQLTVRLSKEQFEEYGHGEVRQPLLAIADTTLKTPMQSVLFEAERPVVLYTGVNSSEIQYTNGEIVSCADPAGGVDLKVLLEDLAAREINEVHVEAGAALCASLVKQQLVDEVLLYVAPNVLGADAKALFDLAGFNSMDQRIEFEYKEITQIGSDLRLRLQPKTVQ